MQRLHKIFHLLLIIFVAETASSTPEGSSAPPASATPAASATVPASSRPPASATPPAASTPATSSTAAASAAPAPSSAPVPCFAAADSVKYWVFLKDKASPARPYPAQLNAAVTDRAHARRQLRGWHAGDESDLDRPLSPDYLQTLATAGATPVTESRWLNAVSTFLHEDQLETIRSLPFVREVRPVGVAVRTDTPTSTASVLFAATEATDAPPVSPLFRPFPASRFDYGTSFDQLNLVNAITLIESGVNGTGVRLGLLDTEFGGFTHPVFDRLTSEGRLVEYRNFTGQSQSNRHGLQVASIMVGFAEGNLIGPAYGAELLAASTEFAPSETNQEEDFFVAGLEWMEAEGADVVNVSLGYTEFDPGESSYSPADMDGDTGVTTRAADIAASLGVLVVAAAGNQGCSSPSECWYFIGTPADGDSVLAVGGTFSTGDRVFFSSRGPTADGRIKPDVAAMAAGVTTATAAGAYSTTGAGTSFAAPIVAAVASQILQVNPGLTPMQVLDVLRMTASQASNPDNDLGWGIIDAAAAVDLASGPVAVEGEQPAEPALVTAFPNPSNGIVNFQITLSGPPRQAVMRLYDVLGREIAAPFGGFLGPGTHRISWNGSKLASGVYVYSLELDSEIFSGRIVRQ